MNQAIKRRLARLKELAVDKIVEQGHYIFLMMTE